MIAGGGVPIDAVVSDFVAGAAESLSPSNEPQHWDVIEGQGSLHHPAYASVTLGLIHGSQPDALILCHDPTRTHIDEYPDFRIPSLPEVIHSYEQAAQLTNASVRCVAVSLNTSNIPAEKRSQILEAAQESTGLVSVDAIGEGVSSLVDALLESVDS